MSSTQAIEHKETARAFDPGKDFLVFPLSAGGAGKAGTIKLGRGNKHDEVIPDASVSDDHGTSVSPRWMKT